MKSALIIQGPLVSTGVTGNFQRSIRDAVASDIKTFDCTESVIMNAKLARAKFDFVIFSGWNYDADKLCLISRRAHLDATILSNPVKSNKSLKHRNHRLGTEFNQVKLNNMKSQFISTLSGLRVARDLGATHAVKIRTDQELDINLLYTEFKVLCESNFRIFVPSQDQARPWALSDFYMGGAIEYLNSFFSKLVEPERNLTLSQNVHDNLFFTLANVERSKIYKLKTRHCLVDFVNFNEVHLNAVRFLWENVITTFSEELYYRVSWRGSKMAISDNRLKFAPEISIPTSLPRNCKPKRYKFYGYLHWLKSIIYLS